MYGRRADSRVPCVAVRRPPPGRPPRRRRTGGDLERCRRVPRAGCPGREMAAMGRRRRGRLDAGRRAGPSGSRRSAGATRRTCGTRSTRRSPPCTCRRRRPPARSSTSRPPARLSDKQKTPVAVPRWGRGGTAPPPNCGYIGPQI